MVHADNYLLKPIEMKINQIILILTVILLLPFAAISQQLAQNYLLRTEPAFEENKGQVTDQNGILRKDLKYIFAALGFKAAFKGNGYSYELYTFENKSSDTKLTSKKVDSLLLKNPIQEEKILHTHRIDISFPGANPNPEIIAEEKFSEYKNYYLAHTPEEGATYVHSYKKLIYKNLYNNIDLVFYANKDNSLKYDIVVRPGGKLSDFKIKYTGANGIALNEGKLTIETSQGNMEENIPISYLKENKQKLKISYSLTGNIIQFKGNYDMNKTLVIDPVLVWGTYYGGNYYDYSYSVNTDRNDNVFISGFTESFNNIVTSGAHKVTRTGTYDAFLIKFNSLGIRLWGTLFGGDLSEYEGYNTIDKDGNIYLSGYTTSISGLATTGAHKTSNLSLYDGYLAKFSQNGIRKWATFYGGSEWDAIYEITLDDSANIYLTGYAASSNGITTVGTHKSKFSGLGYEAFLTKFDSAGNLIWGTYYGGTYNESGYDVVVDDQYNIFITGITCSDSSIATTGTYQNTRGDTSLKIYDAFIAKFDNTGNLLWGTYIGGKGNDFGNSLQIGKNGIIYLAGTTESTTGIATSGSFKSSYSNRTDNFLAKFNKTGNMVWATYYGDTMNEDGGKLAYDKGGSLYLAGYTKSTSNIATLGTHKMNAIGSWDGFIVKFDTLGNRKWGTYYGGYGGDYIYDICYNTKGFIYITGLTVSNSGIATSATHQTSINGNNGDAFLAKFTTDSCIVEKEFAGDTIVCAKTLYSYQTVKRNKYIYKWVITAGTIIGRKDSNAVNVIWDNDSIGHIKLITSYQGCTDSFSYIIDVKINPAPKAKVIPNKTICLGNKIAIGDSAVIGSTYSWTSKPAGFTSTQSNPIVSPNVKTTYYLKETISTTKCTKTDSVIININPIPNAKVIANTSICNGDSIAIGFTGFSGIMYSWISKPSGYTSAKSNPFVKPSITTKYYLTETIDSTGCSKTDSVLITVNPRPNAKITGSSSGCISTLTNYYVVASSGNKYSWTVKGGQIKSGTGTNSINVLWTDTGAGEVKIVQSNTYGCSDSFILPVKINSLPTPKTGGNKTVCAGNIYIGDSAVPGYSYYWMDILNNTSPPATANFTLNRKTGGTLMYILQVTDSVTGCNNNDTLIINLLSLPTPSVNDSGDLCGESITKYFTPYVNGNKYKWNVDGGIITKGADSNAVTVLWASTSQGKLKVIETNQNGCKDSALANIKLWPVPAANTGPDQSICEGEVTAIGAKSILGSRYLWTSKPAGFNSFDANPTINPAVTTTYYLKETISATGCAKTDSVVITVNHKPNPLIKGDTALCEAEYSTYYANGDTGSIFQWKISGGNIIGSDLKDSVLVQWKVSGIGALSVIETNRNACKDSTFINVKIHLLPVTGFSANDTCLGNRIDFINQSKNGVSYLWYFGNGDTSRLLNPSYLYKNAGSYKVKLVVISVNGCKDSITKTIIIKPLPIASISVLRDTSVDRTFTFSSSTYANKYLWSFGDGKIDSGKTVKHTYLKDSIYKVTLVVRDSNGCIDLTDTTINVITTGIYSKQLTAFSLKIYPNPFANSTTLEYKLQEREQVGISIYDLTGKEIAVLQKGTEQNGIHIINIDSEKYQLKAGIYILKIVIGNQMINRQLIKIKE